MTAARGSRPLARRLRVTLFVACALCAAVALAAFYTFWTRQTVSARTDELRRQVSVIASGVAVSRDLPGGPADQEQARARLLRVEAGLIGARLAVTDASGTVLFSTAGASAARSYAVDHLAAGESPFDARSGVLDVDDVGSVLVVAVPVSFSEPDVPQRYLVGAKPLSELQRADPWLVSSMAVSTLVAMAAALGFGWLLARRLSRPIVRLTEGARAIAEGDWGRQVPAEGDDELVALAGAFNEMSVRVADAYRAQRDFVGDVSHELRTPVTSIRGFAQAIGDGTVTGDVAVRRAADVIVDEADRLDDLTTTLLALADLESGSVTMSMRPLDPGALADVLRNRFAQAADDRGITLEVQLGNASPVADEARLVQAASTLIENALRYARSRVRVRAGDEGSRWVLRVEDDGPGVPADERERVFGRFARADGSRSAESGGIGLGLAICRRVLELMGGSVSAGESADLGGASFEIAVPQAPARGSTRTQPRANRAPTARVDTAHREPPHGRSADGSE